MMLAIIYGCIAEVGCISRETFVNSEFDLIEKVYSKNEYKKIVTKTRFGERKMVSTEEFYKLTDSLFRYELGGMHVGFKQEQILDAVNGRTNKVLTLATLDISMIREIKKVYGDMVKTIYCYIDKNTLEKIVYSLSDITEEEANYRLCVGESIRKQYSMYSDSFDNVVIYSGENSEFDMECLKKQYQLIINSIKAPRDNTASYDIFISFCKKDKYIADVIREKLLGNRYSVLTADNVFSYGDNTLSAMELIRESIYASKVFIPIITQNAIDSIFVRDEIEEALKIACKSATTVIPIWLNSDVKEHADRSLPIISIIKGFVCDGIKAEEIGDKLSSVVKELFEGLDRLKLYSERVNNYLSIKRYDKAYDVQKAHYELCVSMSESSSGSIAKTEAVFYSKMKLIDIMTNMGRWEEALDETFALFKSIDSATNKEMYSALKTQVAICCIGCNFDEGRVKKLLMEKSIVFCQNTICKQGIADFYEDLVQEYKNRKEQFEGKTINTKINENIVNTAEIAQHGEAAISLFDKLVLPEITEKTRCGLIEGYQRVLNYCKQLGLSEQISSECIERIARLKEMNSFSSAKDDDMYSALKVFLGQAAPNSGSYDAFISFKSEDEGLARKVYDFLQQNGKEPFFSRETLPQIGNSKYEDEIYNALDHSKHLVLVATNPEYFKTDWVSREWQYFNNAKRGDNCCNLLIIVPDEFINNSDKYPAQLRYNCERIKVSEFTERLLSYLR